jgi:3D (Asp-Asp-Asp) domain-containing protein
MRTAFVLLCLLLVPAVATPKEKAARYVTVVATGYCPCNRCTDGDGVTATGRSAWEPGVAVDPAVISTKDTYLDIPGYNRGPNGNGSWIKADDTGSAIVGHRIDLRFNTHDEAKKYGRKRIKVRVWE